MSESWSNLTNMAESAARGGKYDEAKDCYKRAMDDADARKDANNSYYSRCSLAGLLRLLDDYAPAERLLKEATDMRYVHPNLAKEPVSPITDLERILAKQNRMQEVEALHYMDAKKMMEMFGRDSFECKMSLMALAKAYGTTIKDLEKSQQIFEEVLEWANVQEPVTRKMIYNTYDGVMRGAGLHAEADAAQQRLEALKSQAAV
ncbi:tetratricopeptide repeat protein [Candidatus Obscuribacterales bacterium]|jgi:tetratricopeptide (TPR) repeat protein|nr:tetratricopeptide repeat protein [Candidatus Obscuribacterales bacterium]MBX3137150.1 tetratricopeptide repeat protein [Candidatus Obscuribacterales bacterium]MBX3153545.1 tetratricopeptide repeat protein [Candidatus Obscuribacterales bacterium]